LEEERAILLEEALAKQSAIEAAKQQAIDEAEEKRNLKKRKQEEREVMKAAKKAARKFALRATSVMATGATGRRVQPAQPLYFVAVASKQLFRCS
jgi:hypothetical protein